jgi:hypothetical protein
MNFVDPYCHAGNILAAVGPDAAWRVISDGELHGKWATSVKRQVGPDLWLGASIVTGRSNYVRFRCDPRRRIVDYDFANNPDAQRFISSARAVPGTLLGYGEGTSVLTLHQWRFATWAEGALGRISAEHESEMYRMKAVAEGGAEAPKDAMPAGSCAHSSSDLLEAPADVVFDFVANGETFGQWTWGRAPRTRVGNTTFQCPSEFGGPDLLVRLDVDRNRGSVDFHVGETREAMLLQQTARVFAGPVFDYEATAALLTLTLWRAASQSAFEWERAIASQEQELILTRAVLERR